MGSSPGFVSTPCHWRHPKVAFALFRLGFPTAPAVSALTSRQRVTRWLILQKARRHTFKPIRRWTCIVLRPLVSVWFQVLFHSPRRGSFHLSLTVLVRYRSSRMFSLGQWSALLPTGFLVSRGTQDPDWMALSFAYRALTFSGRPFQCLSASRPHPSVGPATPNAP